METKNSLNEYFEKVHKKQKEIGQNVGLFTFVILLATIVMIANGKGGTLTFSSENLSGFWRFVIGGGFVICLVDGFLDIFGEIWAFFGLFITAFREREKIDEMTK